MNRRRITLKGAMNAVAVIGLAFAALFRPNKLWAIILTLLLVIMPLTATLGSLFRRGPKRAYWTGVALFGWAYLIAVSIFFGEGSIYSDASLPKFFRELLTTVVTAVVLLGLIGQVGIGAMMTDLSACMTQSDDAIRFIVAYSLVGLAFAALGGLIARAFSSAETSSTGRVSASNPPRETSEDEPRNTGECEKI